LVKRYTQTLEIIVSNETAYKERGEVSQALGSKEDAEIRLKEEIKVNPYNQPKPVQKNFMPTEVSNLKARDPEGFHIAHGSMNQPTKQINQFEPIQVKPENTPSQILPQGNITDKTVEKMTVSQQIPANPEVS
jgi:hypothetical protein